MLWVLIAIAYLIGSVSGSLCLGKLRGVDIRTLGSGNAGGTNALRTQGMVFALGVVLIDVGKGLLAVWLARHFLPGNEAIAAACVFAAVIGHIWPLWHGFRGGKGAATLVGGLILLWPQSLILLFAVWILCLLLTGYVGLSTILAAISLPVSAAVQGADAPLWLFAAASALLLTYSHRSNLQRLRAGTENRFEKVRLLGRLLSGRRG
ncbi:glycerol-3-phosphate 1-O-acyltransferase PlsY [Arenimonas sp. GDDSR-1]|uniref:glycerol-3-phosphate 1-O-acyltransferase PlsY n=1 Tax=Arenimonas sp. GDDSR-1 TaxID=2950125 RepID=UPI002610912A|nr:glycerol-3-phosphate 1-O-acyltransferase PlsY [Arenimonas sp. GDDSR-1]